MSRYKILLRDFRSRNGNIMARYVKKQVAKVEEVKKAAEKPRFWWAWILLLLGGALAIIFSILSIMEAPALISAIKAAEANLTVSNASSPVQQVTLSYIYGSSEVSLLGGIGMVACGLLVWKYSMDAGKRRVLVIASVITSIVSLSIVSIIIGIIGAILIWMGNKNLEDY